MNQHITHDAASDLLGAYAVHALDASEYDDVDDHIAMCTECRNELDRLLDASASLSIGSPEPVTPALWGRIVAEVREHPQAAPLVVLPPVALPPVASPPVVSPLPSQHDVVSLDAARARRSRKSTVRVAVASAAAAVALAVPLTATFTGASSPSLAALASDAAGQPGARTITLLTANGTAAGDVILTADGKGFLKRRSLPPLPSDKTYQLWTVRNNKPVSIGVLGSNPNISAFTIGTRTTASTIDAIALSIEPAEGSVQPSATPIAVAPLT